MLGLANVCELAEINKDVSMDILGGGGWETSQGRTHSISLQSRKNIICGDPWASSWLPPERKCAHFI